jgi:glycosyltransferase involved in cell wall biosynthesis
MKIAHIATYPPKHKTHSETGGVASYTKNLVTNMPVAGTDQVFVVCDKIKSKCEHYREDGIFVVRCFDKNPRFVPQVLKAINDIKPDVVHIQQELSVFGSVITAYLLQWLILLLKRTCPVVITLHGVVSLKAVNSEFVKSNNANYPVWVTKLAFYVIYKPLTVWAKKVIVHEDYFKTILEQDYGVPASKITVVYHGVENIQPIEQIPARQVLDIAPDRRVVLFMGYATGYKGIEILLEGFAKYAQIDPKAYLLIGAGKHPKLHDNHQYLVYYQQLRASAANLIVEDKFRWVGFIAEDQIVTYYSASDVSVYPYTVAMSSSGPMAMAMACARPFLVSSAFSVVFDDRDIVFDRSPDGLAAKLADFFNNQPTFNKKARSYKDSRLYRKSAEKTYDIYSMVHSGK